MSEIMSDSVRGKIASGYSLGPRNGAGHKTIAQSLVGEQSTSVGIASITLDTLPRTA